MEFGLGDSQPEQIRPSRTAIHLVALASFHAKMKILFDHQMPFSLAHGGFQTQIEQTRKGLEENGVPVDYVRWWDGSQSGDILHYFGRPAPEYIDFAHQKGMRLVMAELLTGTASRSPFDLQLQRLFIHGAKRIVPKGFLRKLAWESYRMADAVIALNSFEGKLMSELFQADPAKVHCVYNGVENEFLESVATKRGKWLVCTATITERKRIVELAEAAIAATTPLWIMGKPYSNADPYMVKFRECCRAAPELIRYEGPVSDRRQLAAIYREARGFVLLSDRESLSLSALEASACGCPLLLSNLPWAHSVFGDKVRFAEYNGKPSEIQASLRRFYDDAPNLKAPLRPASWKEIGSKFISIYEALLKTPPSNS
jgi:glycosyltransferase involved in cell wall biosynthesis